MDETVKDKIFEPFYTTKGEGKGTGLGLSTVFGIVQQSGAYIWCYSKPDEGTTFIIFFPRADTVTESFEQEALPDIALSGTETILLVEDDNMVRELVFSTLQKNGYTVLNAQDGKDALLLSKNHEGTINIMITDVIMPGMRGSEVAKSLALTRPEMKVIYMSGYTDDSFIHDNEFNKEKDFLQKPFTPDVLLHKVREVLDSTI